ncbi:hypothetical protein V8F06_007613 [Rhypophila decipiens]
MTLTKDQRIANHLEKLPVELHEPILSQLTLRDIIAVAQYAPKGGRLESALEISPVWGKVWPTYCKHKQDLQTLVSLMMPIGSRLYDPTKNALNLTPGQFSRRIARHNIMSDGRDYSFFDATVMQASRNIQKQLRNLSTVTLGFICDEIPLESVAIICPWVMAEADEQSIRQKFLKTMAANCKHGLLSDNSALGPLQTSFIAQHNNLVSRLCEFKHPKKPTPDWTVPQMKAFVDAYTTVQKDLNTRKAKQLQALGAMYKVHHDRLKKPLAPQSPRKNTAHIPQQLDFVADHVLRIVDIDRSLQPRSRQGISRFRYPHASLVPYDWCLNLWYDAMQSSRSVLVAALAGAKTGDVEEGLQEAMERLTVDDDVKLPEDITTLLPIAYQGLNRFFYSNKFEKDGNLPQEDSKEDKLRGAVSKLPRVMVDPDQNLGISAKFVIHENEALAIGANKTDYMPPFDPREMEWLMAFVKCIEWLEEKFPETAQRAKQSAAKRLEDEAHLQEEVASIAGTARAQEIVKA